MGAKPLEGQVLTHEADQPGALPASQALPRTSLKGSPLGSPVAIETSRGTGPGAHSMLPVCGEGGPRGRVGIKELHTA